MLLEYISPTNFAPQRFTRALNDYTGYFFKSVRVFAALYVFCTGFACFFPTDMMFVLLFSLPILLFTN